MLKYFTIMYDKNTMVTSIFEKKKKDICKALTGLW